MTLGEFKPPKRDSEFYFQIFLSFLASCSYLYFAFQSETDVLASFRLGGAYVKRKNNMFVETLSHLPLKTLLVELIG